MSKFTMEQEVLQSYFKSICNSFYIAYEQVKRLEIEEYKLEDSDPYEELKLVENLIKISVPEELEKKYMTPKYSKEELKKRKEELELAKKKYEADCEELKLPNWFWGTILWDICGKSISLVLQQIKKENFSIIVTSKEEIIALMAFFRGHTVNEYDIINTDAQYLELFPTGEKMYEEFLQAYLKEKDVNGKETYDGLEPMKEVIKKYF